MIPSRESVFSETTVVSSVRSRILGKKLERSKEISPARKDAALLEVVVGGKLLTNVVKMTDALANLLRKQRAKTTALSWGGGLRFAH